MLIGISIHITSLRTNFSVISYPYALALIHFYLSKFRNKEEIAHRFALSGELLDKEEERERERERATNNK